MAFALLEGWPLLLVPPLVAVVTGATLAKQSARGYWRSAVGVTLALSVLFFVSTAPEVPHPVVTALILTGMSVTIPVMVTFGIERVTATAPRWIAVGAGIVAYIPIVLITITLTMQLGELLSPLFPGVEIPVP